VVIRYALVSLAGAIALGCASAMGPADATMRTNLAREVELPAESAIATSDGSVRARVPARLVGEFARTPEGSYYGVFDIGAPNPIGCYLFDEEKEPASQLVAMSDRKFDELAAQRALGKRAVYAIDAGNAGAYPYLGIDWIAVLDEGGYHLKQRFGNRGHRSLYCLHEDAGYAKSFESFFAGFLASLELPEAEDPPQYREISVMRVAGQEVGFEMSSVRRDEQGDYRADTQVALLIPASAEEVQANDDYSIELSRPDGSVINEVSIASNGVDLTRLNLEREEGAWTVRGEMQGKSISERFETPEQLTSALEEMRQLQKVVRGEPSELHYWRWLGSSSPSKPIEHVMRRTSDRSVTVDAGPASVVIEMDDLGARLGKMSIGRFEMQMERVYVDGSL
jgi:hypothetical protein